MIRKKGKTTIFAPERKKSKNAFAIFMEEPQSQPKRPVEGEDYYVENGWVVITEKYLRERGYCCRSGCRHCPYGFKKEQAPEKG